MEKKTCRRVSFGEGRRKVKKLKSVFKPCFSVKKCVRKKAVSVDEVKKHSKSMFLFFTEFLCVHV